jgi:hypothetical protein
MTYTKIGRKHFGPSRNDAGSSEFSEFLAGRASRRSGRLEPKRPTVGVMSRLCWARKAHRARWKGLYLSAMTDGRLDEATPRRSRDQSGASSEQDVESRHGLRC